jgi:hypothetical protein
MVVSLILRALHLRGNSPVKKGKMDEAYCTYGEINAYISEGNLKGRDNFEDLGADGIPVLHE